MDKLQIGFVRYLEKVQRLNQIQDDSNIKSTAFQFAVTFKGAVNSLLAGDTNELQLATQTLLDPLAIK